jgi:guanylate kinase
VTSVGTLFVVTGPSGAGKGTLIRELLARRRELEVAVSATTRQCRPGEIDGQDYHFMTEDEFVQAKRAGAFYEEVEYVSGHRYGTLEREVSRILGTGRSCVLEVETQGARAVKSRESSAVTIFIASPTFEELERRLTERATESAGEIGERLALARRQMDEAPDFDFVVVNDSVERAADELVAIADRETKAG